MATSTVKSDPASYIFNHTMIRIKDPKIEVPWFENVLGFECFRKADGPDFTNFFLAHPSSFGANASASKEKKAELFDQIQGIIELCWNWGTENDPDFQYASGNTEPGRGFGHICITVDNLDAACKRFDELGVKFKKRPEEGRMRNIAFILSPSGYWVEILAKRGDQAGA